jgi:hypothetical protein
LRKLASKKKNTNIEGVQGFESMGSDNEGFGKANLSSHCEQHPETVYRLLDSYAEKCSQGKGYLKMKDWEEIVNHVNI